MKNLLVVTKKFDSFYYFCSCYAPEYGSLITFWHATCIDGKPHGSCNICDMNGYILFGDWPDGIENLLDILHGMEMPEYETINNFITSNQ